MPALLLLLNLVAACGIAVDLYHRSKEPGPLRLEPIEAVTIATIVFWLLSLFFWPPTSAWGSQ